MVIAFRQGGISVRKCKNIDPYDIKQIGNNHYRYGLLGRFKDGSVIRVILDEVQRDGKKFLSVFDIEDLRGHKLFKKAGVVEPGKQPVSEGTTSGGQPSSTTLIIPPSEKPVKGIEIEPKDTTLDFMGGQQVYEAAARLVRKISPKAAGNVEVVKNKDDHEVASLILLFLGNNMEWFIYCQKSSGI